MTVEEMKRWIDNASYQDILDKWRNDPTGSPWFQGEIGRYYTAAMKRKRDAATFNERVAASKTIGRRNQSE